MGNKVYANNNEVSCKAAKGMTIAALPDVCFTPPENPATPPGVPIPYPNTGKASDTTKGTKTVKITDKEVGIKNKSYFKTSYGDEAGCAAKKGVITSKNKGKVYFQAWSSDVKFEGKNAVRHMDITTNNHASNPGDTPPWPYVDMMGMHIMQIFCAKDKKKAEEACKGIDDPCPPETAKHVAQTTKANAEAYTTKVLEGKKGECLKARRCSLSPYKPKTCCPGQTPHHLVEASSFHAKGRGTTDSSKVDMATGENVRIEGVPKYDPDAAPCVCCEGGSGTGTHGMLHTYQSQQALKKPKGPLNNADGAPLTAVMRGKTVTEFPKTKLHEAQTNGVEAFQKTFPESNCNPRCIYAQLKQYHERECGISPQAEITAVSTFSNESKLRDRLADADRLAQARADVASRTSGVSGGI